MTMEKLLKKWKTRLSDFRTKAELSFLSRRDVKSLTTVEECNEQLDHRRRQHHYETCIRQWESAIEELEQVLNEN